ncbi:MAG TPA: hypothetical protein VLG71_00945 [Candidatus Limnocylindria bacterium]|nr:hypothetical protein [Candidatus Limnocylindria bacterium]
MHAVKVKNNCVDKGNKPAIFQVEKAWQAVTVFSFIFALATVG